MNRASVSCETTSSTLIYMYLESPRDKRQKKILNNGQNYSKYDLKNYKLTYLEVQ